MKLLLIDQPNAARCNIFKFLPNIFRANIHQGSLDKLYIHSQASFLIKCLKDEKSSISLFYFDSPFLNRREVFFYVRREVFIIIFSITN